MKRPAAPHVWLPLLLLVLTIAGMFLLFPERCTTVDSRIREFYGTRHYVMCAFHALSAAAGCGLFTYDIKDNFTPTGQAVLGGLSLAGAILYVLAFLQALARVIFALWKHRTASVRSISRRMSFSLIVLLFLPLFEIASRLTDNPPEPFQLREWVAAYFSLGWSTPGVPRSRLMTSAWAFLGTIVGLVWIQYLSLYRRTSAGSGLVDESKQPTATGHQARSLTVAVRSDSDSGDCGAVSAPLDTDLAWLTLRRFGLLVATYAIWLALVAGVVSALEVRRSYRTEGGPSDKLMDQDWGARYARSLALVTTTAGGGIATEPLTERNVCDATKAVLGMTVLVGGLPGSAGGGMTWLALLLAVGGAPLARRLLGLGEHSQRAVGIAARLVLMHILAAVVVAMGLLTIEQLTAAYYQASPTFADALLDASSLIGGAGLSSGLAATVTSENLSSGMRQSADLYLYGTAWMMLAMLLGRVLPVWVLCRAAASPPSGQN